jgi:hypothetical protein
MRFRVSIPRRAAAPAVHASCLTIAVCCLGVLLRVGPADGLTIDAFTDPYPPNPDLPASGRPILFVGTVCDGSSCPPGLLIEHPVSDATSQTGLAGVLGGGRDAVISHVVGTANSDIVTDPPSLTMNHNAGASAILEVHYGTAGSLDADLTPNSADAIEFYVGGDMYAGPRPVPCTVTVTSGAGTAGEVTASVTQDLIENGVYTYPFADFTGVDFTDVDQLSILFDASAVTAVDFGIGPIQTNGQVVPVDAANWGRLKAMWR